MKIDLSTIGFSEFQNPPRYHRPAPFWSINDLITPKEARRQFEDMLDVGMSGGFFHARAGLKTPYLGKDWFEAMRAALAAAEEKDGYLWLYDEDMWPSGAAGGEVTRANPLYRKAMLQAQMLGAGEAPVESKDRTMQAAYHVQRDRLNATKVTRLSVGDARTCTTGERLVFYRVYAGDSGQWGAPYANLLNPDATGEFIRRTHEVYARELGGRLGKRIPGIFTDEPNIIHRADEIPWDEALPDLYAKASGRDFFADLPYLCLNGPDARRIRLLVQRTICHRYVEAFSKPLFDWCEKHGIAYTGHYNAEDSLASILQNHSGSLMPHYRYQHIPGIDHLFRQTERMLLTSKQAVSVARQLGHQQVISEIFGGMRHTASFADFRWIANFDMATGVNLLCPHLSWYSSAGRGKRDWPQNWNYQQTYWNELKPLNDYLARVCVSLTQGRPQTEVLMLYPMDAVAASYRFGFKGSRGVEGSGEDLSMVAYYDKKLRGLMHAMLCSGLDADLGDEQILADFARVDGSQFRVGEMSYRVVVVPPGQTWRPSTYALLKQFVAAGGKLVFAGELPTEIDAQPSADCWKTLAEKATMVAGSGEQLLAALDRLAKPAFRLWTAEGKRTTDTLTQYRTDSASHTIFIANTHRDRAQAYELALSPALGNTVAVWNALEGTRRRIEVVDGRCRFTLTGGEAILLVAGASQAEARPRAAEVDISRVGVQRLSDKWSFTRSEPNVLVIDRLQYSVDGGKSFTEKLPDYRVRKELAAHFGVERIAALQPWRVVADGQGATRGEVVVRYTFRNALYTKLSAGFVMERMQRAKSIAVNGKFVDSSDAPWIWDRHWNKIDISEHLRSGDNIVDVTMDYDATTEIEQAYIVGDFGVELLPSGIEGQIVAEPAELQSGSWVNQGYPFYTGRMTYRTTVQHIAGRTLVRLPGAGGILFRIRVNGSDAGAVLWPPMRLEITHLLKPGQNTLEIEVIPSRQNLTGPLHEKEGDEGMPGPFAFTESWFMRAEFSLIDCGLLNGAEILRL